MQRTRGQLDGSQQHVEGRVRRERRPVGAVQLGHRLQLAPGQSVAVWGDLHATKTEEKETVIGEVDWKDGTGAGAKTSNDVFSLGETTVQGWFERFRSSSVYDFLKDISLPFVLALLAACLAWYDKWREGKRSEAAEERAHTLQTWDRMLPISHNLATRYYMPIEGATRAALGSLDQRQEALKAAGDPSATPQIKTDKTKEATDKEVEVFFYLLLMRCRLSHSFRRKRAAGISRIASAKNSQISA